MTETIGTPVLLATPNRRWELKSGNVVWNEGPCVFKHDGKYYLLYSANYYASVNYAVGYAISDSPLGKYKKYTDNPILEGDGILTSGTGHCSTVKSPDESEIYIVYHSHSDVTNTTNPVADRTPCLDKLVFRADGSLAVNGPTVAKQPVPSGVGGYCKLYDGVEITSTCETLGGDTANLSDGYIPHGMPQDGDVYRFTPSEDGYLQIKYQTPIKLNCLWVYGVGAEERSPGSVYAVINGRYKTDALKFPTEQLPGYVIFTGSSLPSGIMVEEIKLYFTGVDENAASSSVSEIITVIKK